MDLELVLLLQKTQDSKAVRCSLMETFPGGSWGEYVRSSDDKADANCSHYNHPGAIGYASSTKKYVQLNVTATNHDQDDKD